MLRTSYHTRLQIRLSIYMYVCIGCRILKFLLTIFEMHARWVEEPRQEPSKRTISRRIKYYYFIELPTCHQAQSKPNFMQGNFHQNMVVNRVVYIWTKTKPMSKLLFSV
ncbi:hypothetical protein ES288_A06G183000v1 [Gossypium darwinii]|uniref:Uncharacterized protein n=1 Tax=Gossypium darwinii TaxID=34276 RepID=A0A5D2G7G4_GOSDA|nr:hypothetical protein ES288_A06G183000v1 [Gossypium darwinii]